MLNHTLLAILQQSEYYWPHFEQWYHQHQHETTLEIQPKQWTLKLKLLKNLTTLFSFLPELPRYRLALILTSPTEWLVRNFVYLGAYLKLTVLKLLGLKIVAIVGSYAKTSTKQNMAHLLAGELSVVSTPKSINTPLGIAQVILKELKRDHQVFIVELGEYYQGDIAKLATFVRPDFGVITPVGRQHLERMGSVETIAATMGELLEYFEPSWQRVLVAEANRSFFRTLPISYYGSEAESTYRVLDAVVSRRGTDFSLTLPGSLEPLKLYMPLYGEHQATNVLPAFWVAQQLHLDPTALKKRVSSLPYISRRHEPTFAQNNILILDNSYNTNPESAEASLSLLQQLDASERVVITLGFVELGEAAAEIHREFGEKLASVATYLGILQSPNALSLEEGYVAGGGLKSHVVIGSSHEEILEQIHDKIKPDSIILFEGGYQELFT